MGSRGADVPALLARTVGAVDVGGGSAQIVAMPAGAGDAAATLDDVRAAVYAASHLGVGAKFLERRLRDRVVRAAADAGDADAAYPCGPRGWEATHALAAAEEEGAAGGKDSAPMTLRGSGDFDACASSVRAALASTGERLRAPAAVTGAGGGGGAGGGAPALVAMALAEHVATFLALAFKDSAAALAAPTPTLRELAASAARFCAMPWDEIVRELGGVDPNTPPERLASRCFDAALVDALMSGGDGKGGDGKGGGKGDEPADEPFKATDDSDAYADDSVGFGVDRDARVVTYLRGPAEAAEAEWTLGAAMALAYPAVARAAGLGRRRRPRVRGRPPSLRAPGGE